MSDIVFVIEGMGGGGAQQVLARVVAALLEDRKSVSLITFSEGIRDQVPVPAAVTRIAIGEVHRGQGPLSGITANLQRLLRLRNAIRESRAPVVVGMVGTTNILVALATRGLRCRVIISERNDPSRQSLGRFWDFLRRHVYSWADLVTANSTHAVESLKEFVPEERIRFVPNPVRSGAGAVAAPKPGPLILAVGRLHEQKAYDLLLEAFSLFSPDFGEWWLRILGDGPLRSALAEQAERLGIADRVEWCGHCPDPFPHYAAADIFVLASRFEGTPNALLEAMLCGMPALVSDGIAGAVELVQDGENGLHFHAGSAPDLARTIGRLAADESLRRRLGAAATRHPALDDRAALSTWKKVLFDDSPESAAGRGR